MLNTSMRTRPISDERGPLSTATNPQRQYRGPKETFDEIEGLVSSDAMARRRVFSEACRSELQSSRQLF